MWHDRPGWRAVLNGKKGVLSALEIGLDLDMGIFFDDWQACLRSHYIYVIRAGDSVTEPTLRHVLLHSGIDEAELEALRAQAEALGPLDPDEPEPDAALPVDLATDDLGGEVGEIAAADVAVDEAGTVLDGDGDRTAISSRMTAKTTSTRTAKGTTSRRRWLPTSFRCFNCLFHSVSERDIMPPTMDDITWMRHALDEAGRAAEHDDVPIGAVAVLNGAIIARAHNRREIDGDPTAHAELLAIREAARVIGHWRLEDVTLYCTLEPCAMCAGAMILARLPRLVVGAPDPKAGAGGSVMDLLAIPSSITGSGDERRAGWRSRRSAGAFLRPAARRGPEITIAYNQFGGCQSG